MAVEVPMLSSSLVIEYICMAIQLRHIVSNGKS